MNSVLPIVKYFYMEQLTHLDSWEGVKDKLYKRHCGPIGLHKIPTDSCFYKAKLGLAELKEASHRY